MRRRLISLLAALASSAATNAAELHVSPAGDDKSNGSQAHPFRTVNRAAQLAQPGDTILIHAGTYRELVAPVNGGTAAAPITYRAAPGEAVRLTGSERVQGWVREREAGVWSATLPAEWFPKANPFVQTIAGSFMTYGQWHHRGDLFCDDQPFTEVKTAGEVSATPKRWMTTQVGGATRLTANFGEADPNTALTEASVRPMVFWPAAKRLDHLTLRDLTIDKAACAWAPPDAPVQEGAIGTNGGAFWTIERCTVRDARAVGIAIGLYEPSVAQVMNGLLVMGLDAPMPALSTIGHHVIRGNRIQRCGQAGIAGMLHCAGSRISGNLVEDINQRQEFGGWETAALKFHFSADLVIEGNLLRRVAGRDAAYGLWLDFANVNARVTRNAICETAAQPWVFEMNHGPLLVDNNLIIGARRYARCDMTASAATVVVHNLFVGATGAWSTDPVKPTRMAAVYRPHSLAAQGIASIVPAHDRWWANVFVGGELRWPAATSVLVDGNAYLAGAAAPPRDAHAVSDARDPRVTVVSDERGLRLSWDPGTAIAGSAGAPFTSADFGTFKPVGMMPENPDGTPVVIDRDFFGAARDPRLRRPGPFADGAALVERVVFDATQAGAPAAR